MTEQLTWRIYDNHIVNLKPETKYVNMSLGLAHNLTIFIELNSELATRNSLPPD
jgi:hypothetical protein